MDLDFRLITNSKNIPHIPANALRLPRCPIIPSRKRQKEDSPPAQQGAHELTSGLPFLCVHTSIHLHSIPFPHSFPPPIKNQPELPRKVG